MLFSLIERANQACGDDDNEDGEVSINSKHALIGLMAIGVIDSERYLLGKQCVDIVFISFKFMIRYNIFRN